MKKLLLIFLFASAFVSHAENKARFASLFTDNMVMQQNSNIKIWGYANPNEILNLSFSWTKTGTKITADETGKWLTTTKTPKAGFDPQHIILTDSKGSAIRINNILIGEVWLCSGQSNMEMIMQNQPDWNMIVENSATEIANANFPNIRFLTVNRKESFLPVDEIVSSGWKVCNPENAKWISAVAFFFGKEIWKHLDVPVGMVVSAYGGSPIQSWIPGNNIDSESIYAPEKKELEAQKLASSQSPEEYLKAMSEWIQKSEKNITTPASEAIALDLPVNLEKSKVGNQLGEILFSKTIQVPANQQDKDLHISLGTVDDMGSVSFNGEQFWQEIRNSRSYSSAQFTVPSSKVKTGDNLIEVKVLNVLWGGGLTGPADKMYYSFGIDPEKYPLNGEWSYHKIFDLAETAPVPNEGKPMFSSAGALYNGMIYPLLNYTFKGCLWYQGESNVGDEERYPTMFSDMILSWRNAFSKDLPFYYVQIAPYNYGGGQKEKATLLRNAQAKVKEIVPNTDMVVTIDIGDPTNIHPARKKQVGDRLASLALSETYHKNIACGYPVVKSAERKEGAIVLQFSNQYGGLQSSGNNDEFEISSDDVTYLPAKAFVTSGSITVSNQQITSPLFVRYCWKDTSAGTIFNSEKLPLSTFKIRVKN